MEGVPRRVLRRAPKGGVASVPPGSGRPHLDPGLAVPGIGWYAEWRANGRYKPLHSAVGNRDPAAVTALLEAGADIARHVSPSEGTRVSTPLVRR